MCDFAIHGISALRSINSDDKHRFMRLNLSVLQVSGCTLSIITVSGITAERVEQGLVGEDHLRNAFHSTNLVPEHVIPKTSKRQSSTSYAAFALKSGPDSRYYTSGRRLVDILFA